MLRSGTQKGMADQSTSRWFRKVHLKPDSSSALKIEDVERVLDSHGPIAVDREASSADVGPGASTVFQIQCATDSILNMSGRLSGARRTDGLWRRRAEGSTNLY